jgi:aminopeptidase N
MDTFNPKINFESCRYGQAGTPTVTVSTAFDKASKTYTITVKQHTPPTKDQSDKVPVMIPIKMGLLGSSGQELSFTVTKGRHKQRSPTMAVLLAEEAESKFELSGVEEEPVPSLLRDFSAPVKLIVDGQTEEHLIFLLANDTDDVNRCGLLLTMMMFWDLRIY